MDAFYKNILHLLETIEDAYEKRRLLPCLALVYIGIDVVSSLERQPREKPKQAFLRWADSYLLKSRALPCTSLELYAARCGVVHSFTAASNLSQKGSVREILYSWGNRDPAQLQEAVRALNRTDGVAVHIGDLIHAFRHGLADYWDEISDDEARWSAAAKQVGHWFVDADPKLIDDVIKKHRSLVE